MVLLQEPFWSYAILDLELWFDTGMMPADTWVMLTLSNNQQVKIHISCYPLTT